MTIEDINKIPFKYKEEILILIASNNYIFPQVKEPLNQSAFRFVITNSNTDSHLPVAKLNPQRGFSEENMIVSSAALSVFNTDKNAKQFFGRLSKSFKKLRRTIGDSLVGGTINSDHGLITEIRTDGHYSLFEFTNCDLSKLLTVICKL